MIISMSIPSATDPKGSGDRAAQTAIIAPSTKIHVKSHGIGTPGQIPSPESWAAARIMSPSRGSVKQATRKSTTPRPKQDHKKVVGGEWKPKRNTAPVKGLAEVFGKKLPSHAHFTRFGDDENDGISGQELFGPATGRTAA